MIMREMKKNNSTEINNEGPSRLVISSAIVPRTALILDLSTCDDE